MKRTIITPISILFGLIGCIAVMAASDLFTPLIQFIHSGTITPLQGAACLVFTVAGFTACYLLLNLLCSYFVPRISTNPGGRGTLFQPSKREED